MESLQLPETFACHENSNAIALKSWSECLFSAGFPGFPQLAEGVNSPWRKSKRSKTIPRGLKPIVDLIAFAARLKTGPFKARLSPGLLRSAIR
jgi:hypothetical protein